MLTRVSGSLGRGVALAGLLAALFALPAFAQETPPAEYGQGAGVTRARTLPRTGGGDDPSGNLPIPALVGVAGLALGAAGGMAVSRRRAARALAS